MASRDFVNNIASVQLTPPQNAAASPLTNFTSLILDTAGYEGVVILVSVGALSGFNGTNFLTFTLQESATTVGANFTNVSVTANLLNTTPSASADFGDQDRPFGNSLVNNLLPAPGTMPNLYAGLLPINANTQQNGHYRIGYIGSQRYIRLLGTWTGAPASFYVDVMGLLTYAWNSPIISSPAPITAS